MEFLLYSEGRKNKPIRNVEFHIFLDNSENLKSPGGNIVRVQVPCCRKGPENLKCDSPGGLSLTSSQTGDTLMSQDPKGGPNRSGRGTITEKEFCQVPIMSIISAVSVLSFLENCGIIIWINQTR